MFKISGVVFQFVTFLLHRFYIEYLRHLNILTFAMAASVYVSLLLCWFVGSCDWEKLLTSVQCAIISEKNNNCMKAYVLR